jgi:hypothetical protein
VTTAEVDRESISASWVTAATLRAPALVTWGLSVLVGAIAASVGAVPPPLAGSRRRCAPIGAFRQPCPPAQDIERDGPASAVFGERTRRVVFLEDRQRIRRSPLVAAEDGRLTLEVVDDGSGFSPEELRRRQQNGHVGLSLLQERVTEAGATMAIISAPGGGTTIRLQFARA